MTLVSRVVAVKGLRPGEITGYGARFTAERPTTIAIVPRATPTGSTCGSPAAARC